MKLFLTACYIMSSLFCIAQPVDGNPGNDDYYTGPSNGSSAKKLATPTTTLAPNVAYQKTARNISDSIDINQTGEVKPTRYSKQANCIVSTFAGKGEAGRSDEVGTKALLNFPKAVAVDVNGNLYVADAANNSIRRVTPDGLVSNFAGTGEVGSSDGKLSKATFYYPSGIAIDAAGNIYIADKGNHKIRMINRAGVVTTLAGSGIRGDKDGAGKEARFDKPVSLAVDVNGNVYVADQCNHKIRKITTEGVVTTLAGNGQLGKKDGHGTEASFYDPCGIAVDGNGNVYVADYSNNRVRKITPVGEVTTLTGSDTTGSIDGLARSATFYFPDGIAVDQAGNVFISDQVNNKIRMLTAEGLVYTVAGNGNAGSTDGTGETASFDNPAGVAVDANGSIYVADYNNHKIRKIKPLDDAGTDVKNTNAKGISQ